MSQNNSGNPMFVLGQEYLLDFTQFLNKTIATYLEGKWGESWFEQCVVKDGNIGIESMNDLSFLLRQLLDLNNHNFRLALAQSFFKTIQMEKPHLTALEQIRKSRNFWAHPNRLIKFHDLNRLAFNIRAIIPANEPLAEKCGLLLRTEETSGHMATIASMTEINKLYRNSTEYRSEMARSLKGFADRIAEFSTNSDLDPLYTSQNHMLRNLWMNWLHLQPLYYTLLWDSLLEKRDPRTGARYVSDARLEELSRELDTENGLRLANEYAASFAEEVGIKNCDCEFCKILGDTGPVFFREDAQQKVEAVAINIDAGKSLDHLFSNDNGYTQRPLPFIFMGVICAAKGNIPVETILDKWSFDIFNPSLEMNSEGWKDHNVTMAMIRLLAIRNGVSPKEVESWDLE